jgi:hypothetical protein
MKLGRERVAYSMEAWIEMSRFTLNAADHTRGTGVIRDFAPCALDRAEWVAAGREFVMNLSVVTTRLSIRSLNCDFTMHTSNR